MIRPSSDRPRHGPSHRGRRRRTSSPRHPAHTNLARRRRAFRRSSRTGSADVAPVFEGDVESPPRARSSSPLVARPESLTRSPGGGRSGTGGSRRSRRGGPRGQADPVFTLRAYAHSMSRETDERERPPILRREGTRWSTRFPPILSQGRPLRGVVGSTRRARFDP